MERSDLGRLSLDDLIDYALERDIDVGQNFTREDILDILFPVTGLKMIRDPIKYSMIQYLPVKDLIKFCRTKKEYREICEDEATWKMVLQRDFGVRADKNARKRYAEEMEKKKVLEWLDDYVKDPKLVKYLSMFDVLKVEGMDYSKLHQVDIRFLDSSKEFVFIKRILETMRTRQFLSMSIFWNEFSQLHDIFLKNPKIIKIMNEAMPELKGNTPAKKDMVDLIIIRGKQFFHHMLNDMSALKDFVKSQSRSDSKRYAKFLKHELVCLRFSASLQNYQSPDDPILNLLETLK